MLKIVQNRRRMAHCPCIMCEGLQCLPSPADWSSPVVAAPTCTHPLIKTNFVGGEGELGGGGGGSLVLGEDQYSSKTARGDQRDSILVMSGVRRKGFWEGMERGGGGRGYGKI